MYNIPKYRFPSPENKRSFSNFVTPYIASEFKSIIVSKNHKLLNHRLRKRPSVSSKSKKSYSFQKSRKSSFDPSFVYDDSRDDNSAKNSTGRKLLRLDKRRAQSLKKTRITKKINFLAQNSKI